MGESSVKSESIFDDRYITEKYNGEILRLNLELRREYECAKRARIQAYQEGKLIYNSLYDRIR